MNPQNNYASLETSKRLVDAGIVLETECCWQWKDPCSPDDIAYGAYGEWILVRGSIDHIDAECIPAPSMAEVWRELPEYVEYKKDDRPLIEYLRIDKNGDGSLSCGYGQYSEMTINDNPTDALIDLLIWVKKEARYG